MKNKKLPPGKAVRDRIPKIITNSGKECRIETLSEPLFYEAMKEKLTEEVGEYLSEPCPEELADIIEVVYRLAESEGITKEELEDIRLKKREIRGGFEKNIFLLNNKPDI
jgi:predicted house-cleaning noncanonical NTP pyrophosphatase (MazG superfamily)